MAGLTIEILNTDAEGGYFADALTYAQKYNPISCGYCDTYWCACVDSGGRAYFTSDDDLSNDEKVGEKAVFMAFTNVGRI